MNQKRYLGRLQYFRKDHKTKDESVITLFVCVNIMLSHHNHLGLFIEWLTRDGFMHRGNTYHTDIKRVIMIYETT